jgi:flagellar biosynthesis GTPase FlhF
MSTTRNEIPARNEAPSDNRVSSEKSPPSKNEMPSGDERAHTESARVYTGRSVEELIPRIEQELGQDAIVTRQRSGLGGGVAGFFQRPFVEIEAQPGHPRVDLYDEPAPAVDRFAVALAEAQATPQTVTPQAAPLREPPSFEPQVAEAPRDEPHFEPLATSDIGRERDVAHHAEVTPEHVELAPAPAISPAPAPSAVIVAAEPPPRVAEPPAAGELRAKLLARGVEQALADELIAQATAHAQALTPTRASFADAVAAVLRARIQTPAPWPADGATVAVVGPGGAGKTSFCAALAGAYRESDALPVACATILVARDDRAYELLLSPQLRAPAPVGQPRVARALAQAREGGLVLLDTPATAISARAEIARLAKLLKRLEPDQVVLALPATFGARAAEQLLHAIRSLRVSSLAITHADQTDQLGAAVQAACTTGVAPAFLLDRGRRGMKLQRTDPSDLTARLLG